MSSGTPDKNVLIVCWDFPPNHAIGGRRWAKIAKSMLRLGYTVSVLTREPGAPNGKIPWISKKDWESMTLYYCPPGRWSTWLADYKSSLGFLKIRIARFLLSRFYNGTVFSKAIDVESLSLEISER